MNVEKRHIAFLKVKDYAQNRKKQLRFNLHQNLERERNMKRDVCLLEKIGYQTLEPAQSEVWCERFDCKNPVEIHVITRGDFWKFLFSEDWPVYSSVRVCEGELLTQLMEAVTWCVQTGHLDTFKLGRFDNLERDRLKPCMRRADAYHRNSRSSKNQDVILEPVKITMTCYMPTPGIRDATTPSSFCTAMSDNTRLNSARVIDGKAPAPDSLKDSVILWEGQSVPSSIDGGKPAVATQSADGLLEHNSSGSGDGAGSSCKSYTSQQNPEASKPRTQSAQGEEKETKHVTVSINTQVKDLKKGHAFKVSSKKSEKSPPESLTDLVVFAVDHDQQQKDIKLERELETALMEENGITAESVRSTIPSPPIVIPSYTHIQVLDPKEHITTPDTEEHVTEDSFKRCDARSLTHYIQQKHAELKERTAEFRPSPSQPLSPIQSSEAGSSKQSCVSFFTEEDLPISPMKSPQSLPDRKSNYTKQRTPMPSRTQERYTSCSQSGSRPNSTGKSEPRATSNERTEPRAFSTGRPEPSRANSTRRPEPRANSTGRPEPRANSTGRPQTRIITDSNKSLQTGASKELLSPVFVPLNTGRLNLRHSIIRMNRIERHHAIQSSIPETSPVKQLVQNKLERLFEAKLPGANPFNRKVIRLHPKPYDKRETDIPLNMEYSAKYADYEVPDFFSQKVDLTEFRQNMLQAARRFLVRKEQVVCSKNWNSVTSLTFTRGLQCSYGDLESCDNKPSRIHHYTQDCL